MQRTIKVLDCTLRDGGRGLEYLAQVGREVGFLEEERHSIAECIAGSEVDIVELGSIKESNFNLEKFAIYQNIETISKYIPQRKNNSQMFVGFYIDPDSNPDKIPMHSPELCDGVRVCLRYTELQKSLAYCKILSKKGYQVFIQPMVTMRYSADELREVIYTANEIEAYALYYVDSYGYMDEKSIEETFQFYDEKLDSNVKIGFHAHNNMDLAFHNVRFFIEQLSGRDVIIDSCVTGMGQGAGNLKTEVVVNYLNTYFGKTYKFDKLLEVCDMVGKYCLTDELAWGYSPLMLIPAVHKAAYKYASELRWKYGLTFTEINQLLSGMPDNMKHRYTQENLLKLLIKTGRM